jgi:hypothetical protein
MGGPKKYWFPAKSYGWGWGVPSSWQGWVVLVAYLGVIATVPYFQPPRRHLLPFALCIGAATAALVLVLWLKGEPPRWRWGGR